MYRQMITEWQHEMTCWARKNHDPTHRIQALEIELQQRGRLMAELRFRSVAGGYARLAKTSLPSNSIKMKSAGPSKQKTHKHEEFLNEFSNIVSTSLDK